MYDIFKVSATDDKVNNGHDKGLTLPLHITEAILFLWSDGGVIFFLHLNRDVVLDEQL